MPQNIHTHNDEQHSLNGCTLNVKYIMKIHFINCSILTYFSYEKKRRNTSNFSFTLIFIEFKTINAYEREKGGDEKGNIHLIFIIKIKNTTIELY